MSGIEFDNTGLDELVKLLGNAAEMPIKEATAIVAKGALNIKKDAQRASSGLKHAPAYPRSIGYDVTASLTEVSAEIGPDKQKPQGALGNLIEYGSVNNSPRPHFLPAAIAEMPKFEKALEDAARKALGDQ
jgi:hypothetical protein